MINYFLVSVFGKSIVHSSENINANLTKKGGLGYNILTNNIIKCDENFYNPWVKEIIAGIDNLPKIDYSLLTECYNSCTDNEVQIIIERDLIKITKFLKTNG